MNDPRAQRLSELRRSVEDEAKMQMVAPYRRPEQMAEWLVEKVALARLETEEVQAARLVLHHMLRDEEEAHKQTMAKLQVELARNDREKVKP